MDINIIKFILCVLHVQGVFLNEIALKDDKGLGNVQLSWKTAFKCTGSWTWENGKFTTCVTNQASQDCALFSLYYPTRNANMVYVRTKLTITKCVTILKNPNYKECQDYMKLLYLLGPKTDELNPSATFTKYQFESNIPNDPKFTNPDPAYIDVTSVVDIDNVSGKQGVQLAFQASQFCGQLKSVEVFYYVCPAATAELVSFVEQPAPSKSQGSVSLNGQCSQNAESSKDIQPTMVCYYNGSYTVTGSCVCKPGYEKDDTQCKACPNYKYKPDSGNDPCLDCGKNTKALANPKKTCQCMDDHFRSIAQKDLQSANCYKPPGRPRSIKVLSKSNSHVTLVWQAPVDSGEKPLGDYVAECINCPKSSTFKVYTKLLQVNISGLGAYADYKVGVYNENEITNMTGQHLSETINFRTDPGAPGIVRDVVDTTNSDGSVTFTWKEPFSLGGPDVTYVVKYGGTTERTSENTITITTGAEDKTYNVQIYAEVRYGNQVYVGEIHTSTIHVKGGIPLTLAIGVAIGVILVVAVALIAGFCFWRIRHPAYSQVVRMEDGTVKLPNKRFMNAGKLYVDPTTYNDVDDAVQEFAYELDRKDLKTGQLLGGGEFAEVYKGELYKNGKKRQVAIKTLKAGASKKDRDDFLGEAAILGQFNDANVVSLEGVILKDRPNVIVLEFMCNGALDKYLQDNDNQFTVLQLLGMARGVASGMKYLSELGFIHRDLAARNILVNEHKICKVSDFGMSREIKVDETYDTQGGKIPVRWTAPEAIQFKKFTTSSDVWSYGVLLWEIVSYGERPYWDWGNYEVLERINAGYRLPPPMSCPKVLHDLMLYCWNKDRTKRPKFGEIRDQLEKWIRNPDLLQEIASVITKTDENLDYTVLQTTHKWLEAIGMSKYTSNFLDQGFATPRQILTLGLEDLEALGVGPIGHRKKIYKAIQNTKIQVEARHNSMSGRRKTNSISKKPGPSS